MRARLTLAPPISQELEELHEAAILLLMMMMLLLLLMVSLVGTRKMSAREDQLLCPHLERPPI